MGVWASTEGAKAGREVMRGKVAEALRRRREGEDGQESGSERWGWRVVSARRRGKVSAKEARKHGMASMEECGMATPPWAAGRVSWKAVPESAGGARTAARAEGGVNE